MRRLYAYEIATRPPGGEWTIVTAENDVFIRDPRSIARSIIERWIHENLRRLDGGRVVVTSGQGADLAPGGLAPYVRVRVFRGGTVVSVGYLGHLVADSELDRRESLPPSEVRCA